MRLLKLCLQCNKEFEKGYYISRSVWFAKKFCSPECKIKSQIGKKPNCGFKKGNIPWNKNLNYTDELKSKLNMAGLELGRTPEVNEKKRGRRVSLSTEFKRGHRINAGEKSYLWKGGITPINKLLRRSIKFREWRESVFERDNWTCQECKIRGGILHPHHIKPWATFPEIRFLVDNGLTLCASCHTKTDTWGVNVNN